MLGRCRWFAKKEPKWVPFLGWGLWAMGMPLVSRKWMQDKRELRRVFDGVARRKWPICTFDLFWCFQSYIMSNTCILSFLSSFSRPAGMADQGHEITFFEPSTFLIAQSTLKDTTNYNLKITLLTPPSNHLGLISFSEGTRLTPKKRLLAAAHASKTNKVLPQHLLLPRTKGFAACVQHLRTAAPHVKAVYDLTIAYADLKPSGRDRPSDEKKKKQAAANGNGNGNGHITTAAPARPDLTFQSPPTFIQSLFCPRIASRWRTLVHVRRFEISSLPDGEAGLRAWLEERWVEKGEVLEELRGRLERGEGWEDGKGK
jgi:hypothetical protein